MRKMLLFPRLAGASLALVVSTARMAEPQERARVEERPAASRPERAVGEPVMAPRRTAYDADDLEIPSFLRRK